MTTLKTDAEITILREAGKRLAYVLRRLSEKVAPGVRTGELNRLAEELIGEGGDTPAFLNYHPIFAERPYPASVCVSVNDEVVHGIPNENDRVLEEGDIVGLDCGLVHQGLVVDAAVTVPVGKIDADATRLITATREGLVAGIAAVRAGARIGDIGHAIESVAERYGYGVVYELGGHGVGYKVHEDPHVPNFGDPGTGEKLEANLVLALEPMFNEGSPDVKLGKDGYTYRTKDGKRSAHFEHTIVVTEKGAEILTKE